MRKTEDIINLVLDIYHGHQWEDMEEFFVIAQGLLSYHGARFKLLDYIKEGVRKEIFNSVVDDVNSRYYGFACNCCHQGFQHFMNERFEASSELCKLNRYDDSEEGFREELNSAAAHINGYNDLTLIFHKFITFKSDI